MNIEFLDLNEENCGLLYLIELPDHTDYLYRINEKQKTRLIKSLNK